MTDKIILPITGIGSLPFDNIKEAINYSLKHDIPFIPQLPLLEGNMIDQIKKSHYLSIKEWDRENECYKIQLVGPHSSKVPPQEIIDYSLMLKEKLHQSPILFIDEPFLPNLDATDLDFYNELAKEFKLGIHCCGDTNWNELLKLPISYISFDSNRHLDNFPFEKFIAKKITVVLGLIPTDTMKYSLDKIFTTHKDIIVKHYKKIWLSPACGLGLHTPEHSYKILNDLVKVQKMYRNLLSNI